LVLPNLTFFMCFTPLLHLSGNPNITCDSLLYILITGCFPVKSKSSRVNNIGRFAKLILLIKPAFSSAIVF
jgi:hypothetical protein